MVFGDAWSELELVAAALIIVAPRQPHNGIVRPHERKTAMKR
jgi:hypothetical protein